jgi:KDO2-lipid IV(A) lauroyltransferase
MRRAFPGVSEERVEVWVRECWENLGQTLWEFTRLPALSKEDYHDLVRVEGVELLQRSHAVGRGVILFTAHYANWELATPFIPLAGVPLGAIARRMKNPYVNGFVTRTREAKDMRVFLHKNAVRESLRWLKQGNGLGILFDQRITDGGVSVPFFGRPAHTTTLPALLALRLGSPVHPIHCRREGDKLRIQVEPAMDLSRYQTNERDIVRATEDMTAVVERWVRECPPLWLWIHDRWKP